MIYSFAPGAFYLSDRTRPTDPTLPIPVVKYYPLMLWHCRISLNFRQDVRPCRDSSSEMSKWLPPDIDVTATGNVAFCKVCLHLCSCGSQYCLALGPPPNSLTSDDCVMLAPYNTACYEVRLHIVYTHDNIAFWYVRLHTMLCRW
jgi:hypothetical protein